MKILVVEDDKMIREGICEYMSEFGYEMIDAEDGKKLWSNSTRTMSPWLSWIFKSLF